MTWFAIYEEATGRLESVGTVVTPDGELTRRGLVARALAFDPRVSTKRWNDATRDFDDVPLPRPVLEMSDFLGRLMPAEREEIFEAARAHLIAGTRKQLQAFVDWLKMVNSVDLGDQYVIGVVNDLETLGLIGPGRAAQVLA